MLRERVFASAAKTVSSRDTAKFTLRKVADQLSHELDKEVLPEQVSKGLYADLTENKILTVFDAPTSRSFAT